MRKMTAAMVLGVVAAAGVWGYRMSQAQPAAPQGLKVGVVDVTKALTECQENLDREKQAGDRKQQLDNELAKLKQEANDLRGQLETALKPGSKEYTDRMQDFFNKMALADAYEKGQQQVLAAETQAWMERLYRKFLDEVAQIARLEGISLVLTKDEIPVEQATKLSELTAAIRSRKVLFSSPSLDLTAKVMENLDRTYSQEKAARSAAGAGPTLTNPAGVPPVGSVLPLSPAKP